jgi:hypothetical protein
MAISGALTGMGSTFGVGNGVDGGSVSYVKVGEVTNIDQGGISVEAVDVTHLESPDDAHEFIPGLSTADPVTVTFNYKPDAADPLYALVLAKKGDFQTTYKNGVKLQYSGVVTNWKPGSPSTTTMVGELTVQPNGLPKFVAP